MSLDPRRLTIDTIRALAMDAVQKANAGHPGTAMALAPVAYLLYRDVMRHNPANPAWAGRDRFVLSAGHACMLQYAALHLSGYDLTLDDLKQFRQWGSRTPGHPEHGHTAGVETTTGPLGQGVGNAVGMAIGQAFLSDRYDRPGHDIVDTRVFAIASDGDLMEGVSQEAASIAGHLGLGRLTVVFDDNHITIDGSTALSFTTEDKGKRFEAYGWHVQHVDSAEDLDALEAAFAAAEAEEGATVVDRAAHAHRLPGAARRRHGEGARRAARRGGGAPGEGGDGVRSRCDLRRAGGGAGAHGASCASAVPSWSGRGKGGSAAGRPRSPSSPPSGSATSPACRATAGSRRCRSSRPARRWRRATPGAR